VIAVLAAIFLSGLVLGRIAPDRTPWRLTGGSRRWPQPYKAIIAAVSVVVAVGVLQIFIKTEPWFTDGTPIASTARCRYPLTNHGVVTCVSRVTYEAAGAGFQRFILGFVLVVCASILSASLGSLPRRRRRRRSGAMQS
jgi:peptidoglycan/LPS O-acetylase OafA/YrhL